ncbi:MAG: cupredoxin domain-containing protein, partial [Nitrososphaeraceae archaeon]
DYTILMDAVPGRVNVVWNLFDKPGEFHIQCREYCGFGHATMKAKLFVEPQTVEAAEKPTEAPNATSTQAPNATSTQAPNATSTQAPATAGPSGTPLTILEGSSVQGSPSYDPATLTVKKGDKITVANKDTLPHTVTSGTGPTDPNSAKQFDTSILEPAATADIETTNINPGEYPFHCTVHPYMMGKLVVQ